MVCANNERTVSTTNSSVSLTIHLIDGDEHLLAMSEVPTLRLCDLYVCTKTCDDLVHIVIGERHVLDIVIHTENVGRSLGITLHRVEQLQRKIVKIGKNGMFTYSQRHRETRECVRVSVLVIDSVPSRVVIFVRFQIFQHEPPVACVVCLKQGFNIGFESLFVLQETSRSLRTRHEQTQHNQQAHHAHDTNRYNTTNEHTTHMTRTDTTQPTSTVV